MSRRNITHPELLESLHYDPVTGHFIRKQAAGGQKIGQMAGGTFKTKSGPYWQVNVRGKPYLAHRLAWFYMHGNWPVGQIDHKDGNRLNNTISNLREATHSQNCHNSSVKKVSRTQVKGVRHTGNPINKYRATIRSNGKRRHLGVFKDIKEAEAAYNKASEQIHGKFAYAERFK